MITNNVVAQTSFETQSSDLRQEIEKLKREKSTLEGKIKGYHYLGNRCVEKDQEIKNKSEQIKRLEEELEKLKKAGFYCKNPEPQNTNTGIQTSLSLIENYIGNRTKVTALGPVATSSLKLNSVNLSDDAHAPSRHQMLNSEFNASGPKNRDYKPPNSTGVFPTSQFTKPKKLNYEQPLGGTFGVYPPTTQESNPLQCTEQSNGHGRSPVDFVMAEPDQSHQNNFERSQNKNLIENGRSKGEKPEGGDLIHFSLEGFQNCPGIVYPPSNDQCPVYTSNGERSLCMQLVSKAAEDLTVDGTSSEIRMYLEETLLPNLVKLEQECEQSKKNADSSKLEVSTLKMQNDTLKDENRRLLRKLQELELKQNNLTPGTSLNAEGWDYVKTSEAQNAPGDLIQHEARQRSPSITQIYALEEQNKKLQEANNMWNEFFDRIRSQYEENSSKLRAEMSELRTQEEQRRIEMENIISDLKGIQHNDQMTNNQLQEKIHELRAQCSDLEVKLQKLKSEKVLVESEVAGLREGATMRPQNNVSVSDLQAENDVLRQQLMVFQEDFDQERRDRAQARSEKDDYKTEIENLKRSQQKAEEQARLVNRQLKSAEANVRQTMKHNLNLLGENETLKNQMRTQQEEIGRQKSQLDQYTQLFQNGLPQQPFRYNPAPAVNLNSFVLPQQQAQAQPMQQFVPQVKVQQPQTDPQAQPVPAYMIGRQNQLNQIQNGHQVPIEHAQHLKQQQVTNKLQNLTEQLPGAWTCSRCTLKNHPKRVVCDACGHIKSAADYSEPPGYMNTNGQELMPRGERNGGNIDDDLITDTGGLPMTRP